MNTLPNNTTVGPVTLKIKNMDAMIHYYQEGLGLTLLNQHKGITTLGRNNIPLLTLEEEKHLKHAPNNTAGLFHTAFLFSDRSILASAVYSLMRKYPTLYTGSADHYVSNAFYFNDPEYNGVELYWNT